MAGPPADPAGRSEHIASTPEVTAATEATLPPATRSHGWWASLDPTTRRPTLAVAAVLALLVFGSQILNDLVPPIAAAGRARDVSVGAGVTMTVAPGWDVAEMEGGGIQLAKGPVLMTVQSLATTGSAVELASAYVAEALQPQATRLDVSDIGVVPAGSGGAARFTYVGIFEGVSGSIEGEVTSIVARGTGVVADAWASEGNFAVLRAEVRAMVATIALRT